MAVIVAYLHPGWVEAKFMNSLTQMLAHDVLSGAGHILPGGGIITLGSGPNISGPRNTVVREFLATGCDWLLMLDSDMVFAADLLDRLLAVADPKTRPIVGGLCHGRREEADGSVSYFPTLYFLDDAGNSARLRQYPANALVEVHATGAACLLVHRTVLEQAAGPEPYPWFAEAVIEGRRYSEDVVFCMRAREAGFPVTVHTGIDVGHVKSEVIDAASYAAWVESEEVTV